MKFKPSLPSPIRWIPHAFPALLWIAAGCATPQNHCRPAFTEPGPPQVVELARSSRSWDGAPLPPYPAGQPEISIIRITIPAGTRLATHYHPVINAGILLAGQLTVVAENGHRHQLRAGDAIIELVDTLHYGINEGAVPAEIVVFYAGTEGGAITVGGK